MARTKSILQATLSDGLVMAAVAQMTVTPVLGKHLAYFAYIISFTPHHTARGKLCQSDCTNKKARQRLRELSKDPGNDPTHTNILIPMICYLHISLCISVFSQSQISLNLQCSLRWRTIHSLKFWVRWGVEWEPGKEVTLVQPRPTAGAAGVGLDYPPGGSGCTRE